MDIGLPTGTDGSHLEMFPLIKKKKKKKKTPEHSGERCEEPPKPKPKPAN